MKAITHSSPARQRMLIVCLLGLGVVYLALMPWLRRKSAEARRWSQVAAAREAEADRLRDVRKAAQSEESAPASGTDPAAELQLARRDDQAGFPNLAARHAERAASLSPKDPEPRLLLADIQLRAHHYNEAIDAYQAALAVDPGNQRVRIGLASLYVSLGWPADAEATLAPARRAAPDDPHLKVALAVTYLQRNDFHSAERLLQEARRAAPADAALWSPLAHVYLQTRRYRDALTISQEALRSLPDNVPLLNAEGDAYYGLNDAQAAATAYRKVLAIQSDNLAAHYALALCYQRLRQAPDERRELEYVFSHAPGFAQTRLLLGKLDLSEGRTAEGQRLLAEAHKQELTTQEQKRLSLAVISRPRNAAAYWQLALYYRRAGDPPRELAELRRAAELDPANITYRQRLGEALAEADRQTR